jgi:hypothetical protein
MAHRKTTQALSYLAAMSIPELCRQCWDNAENPAHTPAQRRFALRLRREAHDQLIARLGESAAQSMLEGSADAPDPPPPAPVPDAKPQRRRAPRIMYIEQKSAGNRSLSDRGPAEIGEVTFSQSGRSLYYKGKTFHRINSAAYANYRCAETGDDYWISGVKKRGTNRLWAGSGPILDATKPKR